MTHTHEDRKLIAQRLDLAASRAGSVGRAATPKQTWFLAGLLLDAKGSVESAMSEVDLYQDGLSIREASELIEFLLKEKEAGR